MRLFFLALLIFLMLRLTVSIFIACRGDFRSFIVRMSRGIKVRKILKNEELINEKVKKAILRADVIELILIAIFLVSVTYELIYLASGLIVLILVNGLLTDRYIIKQTEKSRL